MGGTGGTSTQHTLGEGGERGPQNTEEAIRLFAEGWIAGRNPIVDTDGGIDQNTQGTGPFSTPFCHLSTEWEEQVTTCGWALAFDDNTSDRLPMHLVGGTRLILEGMTCSSSTIELASVVEILSLLTSWLKEYGADIQLFGGDYALRRQQGGGDEQRKLTSPTRRAAPTES